MKMKKKKMIVEGLERRKSTSSLIVPILGKEARIGDRQGPAGLSPEKLAAQEKCKQELIGNKNGIERVTMKYGIPLIETQPKYAPSMPIDRDVMKYGPGIIPGVHKYAPSMPIERDVMKYGPGIIPEVAKYAGPKPPPIDKYAPALPPEAIALYSAPISPEPKVELPPEAISLYSVKEPPKQIQIGKIPQKPVLPPWMKPPVKKGSHRCPIVGPVLPQDPPIRAIYSAPLYGDR